MTWPTELGLLGLMWGAFGGWGARMLVERRRARRPLPEDLTPACGVPIETWLKSVPPKGEHTWH
jgi:hypothetical protein